MVIKKRYKTCILLLMLLVISIFVSEINNVNAEINSVYSSNYVVDDIGLNEAIEDSTALELLGKLVYAVARILEKMLGSIFQAITNDSTFPWADRIVFNGIEILDVNFINPATNSFVGNTNMNDTISKTYATIFSISLSFFTIFVMISAIKLAISTIADQKAKYKKALMDWSLGLIMLFTMHYFIAFIFYLNEQLVEQASSLADTQLAAASNKFEMGALETSSELIENVRAVNSDWADYLEDNITIVNRWVTLSSGDNSDGMQEGIMKGTSWWTKSVTGGDASYDSTECYKRLYQVVQYVNSSSCPSIAKIRKAQQAVVKAERTLAVTDTSSPSISSLFGALGSIVTAFDKVGKETTAISDKKLNELGLSGIVLEGMFRDGKVGYDVTTEMLDPTGGTKKRAGKTDIVRYTSSSRITSATTDVESRYGIKVGEKLWMSKVSNQVDIYIYLNDLAALKGAATNASGGGSTGEAGKLITNLAEYFKRTSFDMELRSTNVTGTKNKGNIKLSNAIMYAVLVAQSLILFISYVKRLFYVLILGLISPAVVAYDFFKRFGK